MQREMKYKAWDDEEKRWVTQGLYLTPEGKLLEWSNDRQWFAPCNYKLVWYLGINDMHGNEIYQGSIIQYKTYSAFRKWWSSVEDIPKIDEQVKKQRQNWHIEKEIIEESDGVIRLGYPVKGADIARGEYFSVKDGTSGDTETKYWDFEVIGSIQENPDLLSNPQ